MSFVSTIKSNYVKYLVKGAGVAALGMVAYDSHIVGKIQADSYAKSRDADSCEYRFNNTQYLNKPSTIMSKLKQFVFNFETEDNTRNFFNSGIGYFKGIGSMLVSNVIPLGLGLGALIGKNKLAKGCGIGLAGYGALAVIKDVLGYGHNDDLNRKF